ncbi:phosphoribosylformylglycinamidine cyclo-ligase, partial [Staphylococcus cohnii]
TYLNVFLEPTRLYVKPVLAVKDAVKIHAMTHITGGGFYENIPRALPEGVTAKINTSQFPTPPIFDWLQAQGEISTEEMYNVFNMGVGFTLIVDKENEAAVLNILKQQQVKAYQIGEIVKGDQPIQLLEV